MITVKPVYKGHSRKPAKMAIMDRWPLYRGYKITYQVYIFIITTVAVNYEGLSDSQEIINIINENRNVGFLYLSPAVPKTSVHYHYYTLK